VLASGEADGYYADYANSPLRHLGRCLTEGFAYQGEPSAYRDRTARGEPSAQLPPQAFVSFLQNHDQVGNRAFGERIGQLAPAPAVRAAAAVYLLAPAIPLLFMGEEFAATTPFLFFCDFGSELREAVTEGRRREFRKFARFADAATQAAIPDPNQPATFVASKLDWASLGDPERTDWLNYYRELLRLRREIIVPRLRGMAGHAGAFETFAPACLRVSWRLGDGSTLRLLANLSGEAAGAAELPGETLFALSMETGQHRLGPWSVRWTLEESP
jgi:maltooligosyltrehalose trehalohydrolase